MKNISLGLMAIMAVLAFVSCDSAVESNNWGSLSHYNDFWFKKCPADTLQKILVVSFNKESESMPQDNRTLVMSLYKTVDGQNPVKVNPSEVQLFVDGQLSEDNTISVSPTGVPDEIQRIKVAMVLDNRMLHEIEKDFSITYILKVEKNPGLDRINDLQLSTYGGASNTPILTPDNDNYTPMRVYINKVRNSLKVGVNWSIRGVVIFFIAWMILSRMVFWRRTSFSKVLIDYHDGAGQRPIRMSGAYELVLTGNPKAGDSFLKKFFVGKRVFECNDFWDHEIILKDGARRNTVKLCKLRTYSTDGELRRGEEWVIYNADGKKATFTTT